MTGYHSPRNNWGLGRGMKTWLMIRRVITPCKNNGNYLNSLTFLVSVCVGGGDINPWEGERVEIREGEHFVLFPGTRARTFVVQAYTLWIVQFGTKHLKTNVSLANILLGYNNTKAVVDISING